MIQVFEGPLCCNTGVCGPDPDQALVDFTADLVWLTRQGVSVRRANLAQDPAAFADSAVARAFVQKVGASGLPLIPPHASPPAPSGPGSPASRRPPRTRRPGAAVAHRPPRQRRCAVATRPRCRRDAAVRTSR